VWGADHGGYITRVQSAVKALTGREAQPEVVLIQMVNLTRDGQPVRMSKRAGTFVTLQEVVEEVEIVFTLPGPTAIEKNISPNNNT